jgi:hypothetical protein
MKRTNISHGSGVRMTEYLIAARAVIILWTNFAVMPAEIVFEARLTEIVRRNRPPTWADDGRFRIRRP